MFVTYRVRLDIPRIQLASWTVVIGIDWPSKLNKHTKEISAFRLRIKSKYKKYVRYYKIQSKHNIVFAFLRELFPLQWTKW
jgi:hypothetical protein